MISKERQEELRRRDERCAAAYLAGEKQDDIAKREGISRGLVSLALKKCGARLPREAAMARFIEAGKTKEARAKAAEAIRRPIAVRFWEKVDIRGPDECWPWRGATSTTGYPQMHSGGTRFATHLALELSARPRPNGAYALHRCDNPLCVNPDHLWWGTQKENIGDAKAKGRLDLSGLSLGLPARMAKCK